MLFVHTFNRLIANRYLATIKGIIHRDYLVEPQALTVFDEVERQAPDSFYFHSKSLEASMLSQDTGLQKSSYNEKLKRAFLASINLKNNAPRKNRPPGLPRTSIQTLQQISNRASDR